LTAFFFQEGLAPINLVVHDEFHRAMPGGTGGVKTIANYGPVRPLDRTHLYHRLIDDAFWRRALCGAVQSLAG
jgi:hypothetical protein